VRLFGSHGSGEFQRSQFRRCGTNTVFETGVLVFHPGSISLGNNVYVGHYTILKGYHKNELVIGDDVWIGQQCFFHSAGGMSIGSRVGIGPGVRIITSYHREEGWHKPILASEIVFAPVSIGDDCDIGVNAVIMPGVTIGRGVQVGAGAVVTADVPDYGVAVGVPAKPVRQRPQIVS
jgi:acetyltransferase-like isoleucine patch superfamily enzyme